MPRFVLLLFLLAPVAQVTSLCAALAGPVRQEAVSQETSQLLRLEESVDAMGSTYSVVVYGRDRNQLEAAVEAAFDEVRRLDRLLSNYRPDSDLSEINRFAAQRPVKVTPEVFQLLSKCLEFSRESEGAFDISVGPLMKVWGFYKGTGHLPRKAEMARAFTKVGYRKIQIDSENRTVRFTQAGVELDPGGIGKGYAVDRMVEILKESGISSALITAGGSSIYALGAPNNDKGWEIKIRDPKNQRKTVTDVYLKDQSLSTSGSYEKFFEADGKIYSHIMDPRTGYPASGILSVSVVAPTALDSEAWTKPYFILGRQWTANHKPKNFRVYICEDRAEQPCAWLQ